MLGRLLRLSPCAEELPEPHVPVENLGVLVEEALTQAFGFLELAGVNQIDGAVGHAVDPRTVVVDDRPPSNTRRTDGRRSITPLLLTGSEGGGLVA